MSEYTLHFVNQTHDYSSFIFFQKTAPLKTSSMSVVWKAIEYPGYGEVYSFMFSTEPTIGTEITQTQMPARLKALYTVKEFQSSAVLEQYLDKGDSDTGYTFANELPFGITDVDLYNYGGLAITVPSVGPGQKITFEIPPNELCVAVFDSPIKEGSYLTQDFTDNENNYTTLKIEDADNKAIIYSKDSNGKGSFSFGDLPKQEKQEATTE